MLAAWKKFTDSLNPVSAASAPWGFPLSWPARAVEEVTSIQHIDQWPLGFEDLSAPWGPSLREQLSRVPREVAGLRHGNLERDWLNALGALAVVSEFWRIHHALERYQAQAASIYVENVAMLPHDYRWKVRLHGANTHADRDLSGRWNALKQAWRGMGKTDGPQEDGLVFPTAFPEEWLGEGTKMLLSQWANPPRMASGYELAIEADKPLAEQLSVWFGPGYQKQWLKKHLGETLDQAVALPRRPRM